MNWATILFWALLVLLLALFLFLYSRGRRHEGTTARTIATDGIFSAIILLLGLVPQLGYIQLFPGISLTLSHIPVLIGAALFGWKRGALYGLLFGITSLIQGAINGTGLNVLFVYPWVSIPPRVLFGLIAGLCFAPARRNPKIWRSAFLEGLVAFLMTALHTALVFGDLLVFFPEETLALLRSVEPVAQGVGFAFLGALLLGALGEATLAALIVPAVGKGAEGILHGRERERR